ncbi:MAG: hypothetical protein AAFW70_09075 [Cyanobacteria bacterium J06635_10]
MQTIHFKYNSYQLQAIVTPSGKLEFLVPSLITALGKNGGGLGRKLMNGIAKQYKQRRLILPTNFNKPYRQLTVEKDILLDYFRHNVQIKEFASLANFLSDVSIPQFQNTSEDNTAQPSNNPLVEELEPSIDKSPKNGWYYFLDSLKAFDFKLKTNAIEFKKQFWDAIPDCNKKEEPQPEEFHYHRHLINLTGLEDLAAILETYKELVCSNRLPENCLWGLIDGQIYYAAKSAVIETSSFYQQKVNEKYVSKYLKLVSDENKTKQTIDLINNTRYNGWLLAPAGVRELAIHFAAQRQQSLAWENHLNTVVVDIPTDCDDFTKIPVEVVFKLIDNLEGHPIDFNAAWKWSNYSQRRDALDSLESKFEEGSEFLRLTAKTTEKGGRPIEKIYLTIDCFKHFCMMANTKKGKECRKYLIDCEKKFRLRRSISTTSTTNYSYEQFINKEIPIPALTSALSNQELYSRYAYLTIAQYLTSRKNSFDELWQEFVVNPPNLKTAIAWDKKIMKEAARWGMTSQDTETMYRNTLTATALKKCVKQGTISIENAQTIEILLKEALLVVKPLIIAPKRPRLIQPAVGVNTTPGDKAKELESSKIIKLLARRCVSLESKRDIWYKWDDLIQAINQDADRMDLEIQHRIWQKLDKSSKRTYRKDLFINKKGIAQTVLMYSGFVYPNSKIEAIPEVAEIFFNSKEILDILDKRKLCYLNQAIRSIDFDGIANNAYISDWVKIDESNNFYEEKTDFGTKYQEVHINKLGFVQLIQSYLKRKEKIDGSTERSLEQQFALLDIF